MKSKTIFLTQILRAGNVHWMILCSCGLGLVAVMWHWVTCLGHLLILMLLSILIAIPLFAYHTTRRQVWLDAYLLSQTVWYRLLRGPIISAFVSLFFGTMAAILLLFEMAHWTWQWVLLPIDIVFFMWLQPLLSTRFQSVLAPVYRAMVLRSTAVWLNAMLLSVILGISSFITEQPDYSAMTMAEAVTSAMRYELHYVPASCAVTTFVMQVLAAVDGAVWWWAQSAIPYLGNRVAMLLAWILFLLPAMFAMWGMSYLLLFSVNNFENRS